MDSLLKKHAEEYSFFNLLDEANFDIYPGDIFLSEEVCNGVLKSCPKIYIFLGFIALDQILGIKVVRIGRTKDILSSQHDVEIKFPRLDGDFLFYGKWNSKIPSISFLKNLYKKTYYYNNRSSKLHKIIRNL